MAAAKAPVLTILRTPGWCVASEVQRFFAEFFLPPDLGISLNWNLFHNFISLYFMDLLDSENLVKFVSFALTTFLQNDCPSSYLVQGMLELRERHEAAQCLTFGIYKILCCFRRPQSIEWECTFGRYLNTLRSANAVYGCDLVQLKVLVKYGFTNESPTHFPTELTLARKIMQKF